MHGHLRGERRKIARTKVDIAGHLLPAGQSTLLKCDVLDLTNEGARLNFGAMTLLREGFDFSFDKFRTIRKCRLVWVSGHTVGIAFVSS